MNLCGKTYCAFYYFLKKLILVILVLKMVHVPLPRLVGIRVLTLLLVVFWMSGAASAYHTKIMAAQAECFTESVHAGGYIGIAFEVTAGGVKDIDATVTVSFLQTHAKLSGIASADSSLISQLEQEWKKSTSGEHTYHAPRKSEVSGNDLQALPHKMTVCFDNKESRWTPKWISFTFTKQEPMNMQQEVATVERELELQLHENGQTLFHVQNLMTKIKRLEDEHREVIESTNTWIMVGAFVNGGLLVSMSAFQYWYLTRFLSVKR